MSSISRRDFHSPLKTATRALDNLLSDPDAYIGAMLEKGYQEAVSRLSVQRSEAIARRQSLESELARPDLASAIPLLQTVRADFPAVWAAATALERRRIVHLIIERIDLAPVPPNRRYIRGARVKLWDVYADLPSPNLPPFPKPRCGFPNESR